MELRPLEAIQPMATAMLTRDSGPITRPERALLWQVLRADEGEKDSPDAPAQRSRYITTSWA